MQLLDTGKDFLRRAWTQKNKQRRSKNKQQHVELPCEGSSTNPRFFLFFSFTQLLWWSDPCTAESGNAQSQALHWNATSQTFKRTRAWNLNKTPAFCTSLPLSLPWIRLQTALLSPLRLQHQHDGTKPGLSLLKSSRAMHRNETKTKENPINKLFNTRSFLWRRFLSKFFLYASPQKFFHTSSDSATRSCYWWSLKNSAETEDSRD